MHKADYVRSQGQTRDHTCHWIGCTKQCPPAMFMCKHHWFKLPKDLQRKIWKAFVPGQEVTMSPSAEYLEVVEECMAWIRANDPDVKRQGNLF